MLNKISPSLVGMLFLDTPVACRDIAGGLACPRTAARTLRGHGRRVGGTRGVAAEPRRLVERAALAAIRIGVVLLLGASIASLFGSPAV